MDLERIPTFRLVERGGAGLACDADGVSLGGIALASVDTVGDGRRCVVRSAAELGGILAAAYGPQRDELVQRCHRGLNRAALALEAQDLALAGIETVMLALPELDADAMAKLARLEDLRKGGDAWCDEPRLPAGQPGGGQWTTGGGSGPEAPPTRPGPSRSGGQTGERTTTSRPPRPQSDNGFQPDGAGGFVLRIPSVSAGQQVPPTEVRALDANAFQVGYDPAGVIQLKDAKGNVYSVAANLPAIEQFNSTTGHALGVSIRAFPTEEPSSPDPVSTLVDFSNTAAGALVDTADWLAQPATHVPIALEIAAGDPEFPMGAAAVATTDPSAFREWRPVSNLEVGADALSVVGAVAPVARLPVVGDAAAGVAGRTESVAAELARNTPGVVTASRDLSPASGAWLKAGVPTPIPSQVADPLVGQRFNTFAGLRGLETCSW